MTTEAKVKAIIREQLTSLGPDCYWFMPPGVGLGRSGIPDFAITYKGRSFFIEAKADGGRVSPHQVREMRNAIRAGALVWVVKGAAQASTVAASIQRTMADDEWAQTLSGAFAPPADT